MKTFIGVSAIILCTSFAAHAQDRFDARVCVELAKAIVAKDVVTLTDKQYTAMNRYAFCEAKSSSSGATLDVAYKAFSLGGTYSDEEKNKLCTTSASDLGFSEFDYRTAIQYFSEALPTIDKCLTAANAGWNVNYQAIQKDAVSLGVSHSAETGGIIHGIDIISSGDFSCSGVPENTAFPFTVLPTKPLTMTCIRKPTKTMVAGVEVTSSNDATVNLRFASGPLPITLKGYSGSVWDKLSLDIQKVQQATTTANDRMNAYSQALIRWAGGEAEAQAGTNKATCPEGQYVAGVQGIDTDGGRFCVSCISHVKIFCRPLPRP
ncbi:hypothetical protein [Sinorhizobium meliloti]|uniref:hypothetical protein n=1 Tax=Rhizobium meliloti TaxID=382 RepID=UPI00398D4C40